MTRHLNIKHRPRVWVGCLHCYNNGWHSGIWVDAEDAPDVTLDDVHGDVPMYGCEELLCLSTENLPSHLEDLTPADALKWWNIYEQVGQSQWPALLSWIDSQMSITDEDGLPDLNEFECRYMGEWDTFHDFISEVDADFIGELSDLAQRYFDWDKYERDALHDYLVTDTPRGTHYVFINT